MNLFENGFGSAGMRQGCQCNQLTILVPARGTTVDRLPYVEGIGTPGSGIQVVIDHAACLCTEVGPDGRWGVTNTAVLANGEHTITVKQDNCGYISCRTISFYLRYQDIIPAPVITYPADGQIIGESQPIISGTGIAGNVAVICLNQRECLEAAIGPEGTFKLRFDDVLPDGDYVITGTQRDMEGNSGTVVQNRFGIRTQGRQ
ncbi:hypothetical protein [Anaerolentibacter hominis]|uniref:hypothetical protein n=1 Tax=Anaerolentibacter hominis TaxID=3079009 RepID=UPI0031B8471E